MADFAASLYGGFDQGRRRAIEQRDMLRAEKANALLGQAFADPNLRQQSLAELAPFAPDLAYKADADLAARDDRINLGRANFARTYLAMPAEGRARFLQQFGPDAQRLGLDPTAPDFEQQATGYAAMGQGGAGSAVHSTFINGNGERVAIMRDGSEKVLGAADVRTQLVDVPGVGPQVVDLRNATSRVVTGGQSAPPQSGSPQMDNLAKTANAMIAAGVPPEKVDAFLMNAARQTPGVKVGVPSEQPNSQSPQRPAWVRPVAAQAGNKPPAGYRFGPDGSTLEAIPGGPADKPQAQDKPLPVGALRLKLDAQEALSVAQGVDDLLAGFEQQIADGILDLGPVKNLSYEARNAANQSNPQSQAYASFKAGLEKLRNDSLRLNKGVQTDGDAQRAWNELMANINDIGVVKQRLAEIRAINKRGEQLQRDKMQAIEGNYSGKPAAEDDISDLLEAYGDSL